MMKHLVNDIREEIVASYILLYSKSRVAVISHMIVQPIFVTDPETKVSI